MISYEVESVFQTGLGAACIIAVFQLSERCIPSNLDRCLPTACPGSFISSTNASNTLI